MPKYPIVNTKKTRTIMTENILKTLKAHFDSDPKPSKEVRALLAKQLDLSEESVRIWFQNRRSKARSTGELPAVYRDRGNRFMKSSQLRPYYTSDFSPSYDFNLLESNTSMSPTYFTNPFNYLPLKMTMEPQLSLSQNDYHQISMQNFELTTLPLDITTLNDLIIQEFLFSTPSYQYYQQCPY